MYPETLETEVFTSFVDKRGVSFEKQQARDNVSYMKYIARALKDKEEWLHPKKPFSFHDYLLMREKEQEEEREKMPRVQKTRKMVQSLKMVERSAI